MRMSDRHTQDRRYQYALSVLLGMDGAELPPCAQSIYYGDVQDTPDSARIVIKPSDFFRECTYGTESSLPELPLDEIMGVPLLFGTPKVTRKGGRIVTDADLIASAYFLLTRYEEVVRRDVRDKHGRFPGWASLPYRAGFLDRPIVDEYARVLGHWLGQVGIERPERPQEVRRVYLTHDVDIPWRWANLRAACRASLTRLSGRSTDPMDPLLCYIGVRRDPEDCFDWILERDRSVVEQLGADRAEFILFLMAGGASVYDGYYRIESRRIAGLIRKCLRSGAKVGLHASYEAGGKPELVWQEAETLADVAGTAITDCRYHFLRCCEPEDLRALVEAGITRDFTLACADVVGFRLGTCRGVKWFDIQEDEVADLTLYPLTLMACTLDRPDYMGLDYEQAYDVSAAMFDQVRRHNGDLVLLWHNTELATHKALSGSYQKRLYMDLLGLLGN